MGPVHLVLGGSGDIGSVLCRQLAAQGARVAVAGRSHDGVHALADEIDGLALVVDATDGDAVTAAVGRAVDTFGQLDGAVNCVGSVVLKPAHLTRDAEWDDTLATNLSSAFYLVRAATKRMMRQETGGSVVLVATAAARLGIANHEAIAAAKGGVIALGRSAAATYGPRGVRVNVVAPGLIETKLTQRITSNERSREASLKLQALGRLGQPGDVARAIAFLLDPAQVFVTGQVWDIDGGLAATKAPR